MSDTQVKTGTTPGGTPWKVTISAPHVVVCPDRIVRHPLRYLKEAAEADVRRIHKHKRCGGFGFDAQGMPTHCPDSGGLHTAEDAQAYAKRRMEEVAKGKKKYVAPKVPHAVICPDGQRRWMVRESRAAADEDARFVSREKCTAFASFATPCKCPNSTGVHKVESIEEYNRRMEEKTMAAKTSTKKKAVKKGAKGARASVPAVEETPKPEEAAPPATIPPQPAIPPPAPFRQESETEDLLRDLQPKLFSGTEEERRSTWEKILESERRRRTRDINERVFSNAVATATAATVGRVEGNLLELTKALVSEARRRDTKKARKKERVHIVLKGGGLDIDIKTADIKDAAQRLRKILARIDSDAEQVQDPRTLILQFNEVVLAPGAVETMRVQVQTSFKSERFVLDSPQLSNLVVEDIRVGGSSMFDSADGVGVVPATSYGVEAVGVGNSWKTAQAGQFIVVKLKNNGKVPAVARAAAFGCSPKTYRERGREAVELRALGLRSK